MLFINVISDSEDYDVALMIQKLFWEKEYMVFLAIREERLEMLLTFSWQG